MILLNICEVMINLGFFNYIYIYSFIKPDEQINLCITKITPH